MDQLFRAAVAGYRRFLEDNIEYTDRRSEFIDRTNEDDAVIRYEFMQQRIRYRLQYLDFMNAQTAIIEHLRTVPGREVKFSHDDHPEQQYIFALNDQDQLIIQQLSSPMP